MKRRVRPFVLAYSVRNRTRKAAAILEFVATTSSKDALFIGTLGEENADNPDMVNAGIVEKHIADVITVRMSINIEHAVTPYPFMLADARDLPFQDDYVDFALANAIIEHVGDEHDQRRMIDEMTRVARSWVATTPNKWFPVEAHTSTLFLHWFPAWRSRRTEFTRLLSRRQFRKLLPDGARIDGAPWGPTFSAYYTRGPSLAQRREG